MYIASIHIRNFRCFQDTTVDFNPGVNVIIGENNAGKTALLRALGLVFDREHRPRLTRYDFYQGIKPLSEPPKVEVTVTLRSSGEGDTLDDKALVATWLTKLESPWEAKLTYQFFLPEDYLEEFTNRLDANTEKDNSWEVLEYLLPKYVSRIYGGNPETQAKAEPEWLSKFSYQFLDAIRDVESDLFSGSNPMLREMLKTVLDVRPDKEDNGDKDGTGEESVAPEDQKRKDEQRESARAKFHELAGSLKENLVSRLGTDRLFDLVKKTGADFAGKPELLGAIGENDLIGALKLFINAQEFDIPATHNGLGYNNLLYISLVLANVDIKASVERAGENAVLFPILLIEEPEAHLHPAMQYKLLKYFSQRVEDKSVGNEQQLSRQVFVTTHSTHITAAVELDSIICMSAADAGEGIGVAYPGKVFNNDSDGRKSKKYVERFLDATKSNMLFAKGVIFVEGLTEQLLLPCFAEYVDSTLEDKHVAVIAVGGNTFKHFLPIYTAGPTGDANKSVLRRRVACIVDADPSRKKRNVESVKGNACLPCQLDDGVEAYEYEPKSGHLKNLEKQCSGEKAIRIFHGKKTLEYDIAEVNSGTTVLITDTCTHAEKMRDFVRTRDPKKLPSVLDNDELDSLDGLKDKSERCISHFASCMIRCSKEKGEYAFDLERALRENLSCSDEKRQSFSVPEHIEKAIRWACRTDKDDEAS